MKNIYFPSYNTLDDKMKNITNYSKSIDKEIRNKLLIWANSIDVINILFDLEIFNTTCENKLKKFVKEIMDDVLRVVINLLYNIISLNYNFIDLSLLNTLVLTTFILSAKIVLGYDYSYNDCTNYIRDLTNLLDSNINVKNIITLEIKMLKSENWMPSYKAQKRIGILSS